MDSHVPRETQRIGKLGLISVLMHISSQHVYRVRLLELIAIQTYFQEFLQQNEIRQLAGGDHTKSGDYGVTTTALTASWDKVYIDPTFLI